MDRVRFGRTLGFGVRQAAKTMVRAMDAAMAESPASKPARQQPRKPEASSGPARSLSGAGATRTQRAGEGMAQARQIEQGVRRGSKRFGEAVWAPVARLSGVLWLEVTGGFFGLFALVALGEIWRLRAAFHATAANQDDRRSLLGALAMLGVFGYFCVSSFVRARRRQRRR